MRKIYRYSGKNIHAFLKKVPRIYKKTLDVLSPSFQKDSIYKYPPTNSTNVWNICRSFHLAIPDVNFSSPPFAFNAPNDPLEQFSTREGINPFQKLLDCTSYKANTDTGSKKLYDDEHKGETHSNLYSTEFSVSDKANISVIAPLWALEITRPLAPILTLIILRTYNNGDKRCIQFNRKGTTCKCNPDVIRKYLNVLLPTARYTYACAGRTSNPFFFTPHKLTVDFWSELCALKMLYEMAMENLSSRFSTGKKVKRCLPWNLYEQATLFSLYSVIPFDPLLDWQDIKREAPTLATPKAFELYLCVLLAPLFSSNGKPEDSISKEWDKFVSEYNSICIASVPLDILIQFTYMPDDVEPDGSFGGGWSSDALSKYMQSALQLPLPKISQFSCELREKGAQQAYSNYSSLVTSLISESAKAPFRFYSTNASYLIDVLQPNDSSWNLEFSFRAFTTHYYLESLYIGSLTSCYARIAKKMLFRQMCAPDGGMPPPNGVTSISSLPPFEHHELDLKSVSAAAKRSNFFCDHTIDYSRPLSDEQFNYLLGKNPHYKNDDADAFLMDYLRALDTIRWTKEGSKVISRISHYMGSGWEPIWFTFHPYFPRSSDS